MKWKVRWAIGSRRYIPSTRPATVGRGYGADPRLAGDFNQALSELVDNSLQAPERYPGFCNWLSGAIDRLKIFAKLGEDWDGYGAAAPTPETLSAVEPFLREAASSPRLAPTINPTRSGGVLLSWKSGPHRLEVQFTPEGASFVYLNTESGETERGTLSDNSGDQRFWTILNTLFAA